MLNQTVIQGRITVDLEVKYTSNGTAICVFVLACDRPKYKDGEMITDFVSCVSWGKTAEFIGQYFSKGSMIIVGGRLQSRTYDDADGKRRRINEIAVNEVNFAGGKNSSVDLPDSL